MIKPNFGAEESGHGETMTPMIDVIFTLIAFMMLMINTPLLTMELDLPQTEKSASVAVADPQNVTVVILPQAQQWRLDHSDVMNAAQLQQALHNLQQKNDQIQVLLTTDKHTEVQRLISTITILNKLQISGSQIAINEQKA
ncbi:biopolymer transporter ExbD [uncultured Ferrimonas sp.]|uniref:ExbD/TolR family protein n=1 Tax=uncultured Ferrimonas sp. TaxID=432640 RepID=UPI002627D77C|nr:biopolymer transporter ExbD [uncultured Ferrimonas sp.]